MPGPDRESGFGSGRKAGEIVFQNEKKSNGKESNVKVEWTGAF